MSNGVDTLEGENGPVVRILCYLIPGENVYRVDEEIPSDQKLSAKVVSLQVSTTLALKVAQKLCGSC